jgi:8-amino-7-oxononanoate synthase
LNTDSRLEQILAAALQARQHEHLLRRRVTCRHLDATHVEIAGRRMVNFATNDYLGLAWHPRVREAAGAAARSHGAGSGASALVSGYTDLHAQAEEEIARWKGTQAAVILPSGYQANLAAIVAIAKAAESTGRPIRLLMDKLVHASLIDAVALSGCRFRVFPHNGIEKLSRLLVVGDKNGDASRFPAEPPPLDVIVTESIYSMDGDAAPVKRLAELSAASSAAWLLDEAHGTGVYGQHGSGYAAEQGVSADVTIVTLSKAMGCSGGAVCGSRALCDAIVNFGRAYVYSTALPPPTVASVLAALAVMRDEPSRQARVRELGVRVRAQLASLPLDTKITGGDSPIIAVVVGDAQQAIGISQRMADAGYWIPAIRPPTIPPNQSRLRITLSSEHSDTEIDGMIAAMAGAIEGA